MKKPFYTHVAGLRAWAVILVCFYHFKITGFGGGFIGVDIFFVISGFLMGGILDRILRDSQRKRLWAIDFILARAQRIMPALLVVTLSVMVWGWFRIASDDFNAIALEGIRAILFVSNQFYAQKTDYFAPSADLRMFLHSWSLSVEWAFYLLISVAALGLSFFKRGSSLFVLATALMSLVSLISLFIIRKGSQMEAFFYLMPRAWELGVGILSWHISQSYQPEKANKKLVLELSGFALLGICLVFVGDESTWPGPATLLAVLGSSFILIAANEGSFLTAPRLSQGIGEISYSVYLWHWPIAVMLTSEHLFEQMFWKWIGIVASLAMGLLSYWIIERPTRNFFGTCSRFSKILILLAGLIATGLVFAVIRKFDGFPNRVEPEVYEVISQNRARSDLDRKCMASEDVNKEPCYIGSASTPSLLIVGDSHAGAMLGAIAGTDFAKERTIEIWTNNSCPPIFDLKDERGLTNCALFLEHVEKNISRVPASVPIVIISRLPVAIEGENSQINKDTRPKRWLGNPPMSFNDEYRMNMIEGLANGICRIGKGRKIFVFAPIPDFTRAPLKELEISSIRMEAFAPLTMLRKDVDTRQASSLLALEKAKQLCGAEIIPVLDVFCDETICTSLPGGVPAYRDDDHLSQNGAMLLAPRFDHAMSLIP